MTALPSDLMPKIWEFIRGDASPELFECWVYQSKELEQQLPHDFYQEVIAFNYKQYHRHDLLNLKINLQSWVEANFVMDCACLKWRDKHTFIISVRSDAELVFIDLEEFENQCQTIRDRTSWLRLVCCSKCQTYWYTGIDSYEDELIIIRLNEKEVVKIIDANVWPVDFDDNKVFWPSSQ